eukprot:CAMPEP_0113880996 /NCGR_PEP_ID=MMETSP0780_2-20120614/8112_1 /TAXON_ID=652834 /ORGANISM="Palpitomonas bilix" /LENGTH=173 /DNA_ID=CAMNT_0000867767 /DNA_START=277 /DNA_END=794 /DNA_ORIENTATION=+ /assembly_acc=CAM_ASM_000599
MPPKKKKTLKKGSSKKSVKSSSSKGGGGSGGDTGSNFIPPVLPDPEPEQFVTLDVKLITWEYLDFTMEVSLDCRLFAVMDAIVKKHGGSIASLTLYKDEFNPKNVISGYEKTLRHFNFPGGEKGQVKATIYYDFEPAKIDCPVLLTTPQSERALAAERTGVSGSTSTMRKTEP